MVQVNTLSGKALDLAVAMSEGFKAETWHKKALTVLFPDAPRFVPFQPSKDWIHGGQILEREKIRIEPDFPNGWLAMTQVHGTTALEAAMRYYVSTKFGEEIDLPNFEGEY